VPRENSIHWIRSESNLKPYLNNSLRFFDGEIVLKVLMRPSRSRFWRLNAVFDNAGADAVGGFARSPLFRKPFGRHRKTDESALRHNRSCLQQKTIQRGPAFVKVYGKDIGWRRLCTVG